MNTIHDMTKWSQLDYRLVTFLSVETCNWSHTMVVWWYHYSSKRVLYSYVMWSELAHPLLLSKQQGHLTSHHTEMICQRFNIQSFSHIRGHIKWTLYQYRWLLLCRGVLIQPCVTRPFPCERTENGCEIKHKSVPFYFSTCINSGVLSSTVLKRI